MGHADGGKLPHVDLEDVGRVRIVPTVLDRTTFCNRYLTLYQCIANIMVNPEPHGGKTYNLIGEYQSGSFIVNRTANEK